MALKVGLACKFVIRRSEMEQVQRALHFATSAAQLLHRPTYVPEEK